MHQEIDPKIQWPGWEVVRLIGRGSFGAVYEIQHRTFNIVDRAALKVITIPQSESEIEELYSDGYDEASVTEYFKGYLEDILREYSLMLEMRGHTNVVYCDDLRCVQQDNGIGWDIYIKMELLTPMSKGMGREYDEAQAIRLGMDICSALVLCRSRNIVHRDIKPENIFMSSDGNFKLGDFGIAKTVERTTSGTKTGTFKYMAPEVYNNQSYGSGADIYSLGLVLYWIMNERRTPFLPLPPEVPSATLNETARRRRFSGEPLPAPKHGSEALKRIVLKACAYNPKDRFASAEEMLAALASIAPQAAPIPVRSPEPEPELPEDLGPTVGRAPAYRKICTQIERNQPPVVDNPGPTVEPQLGPDIQAKLLGGNSLSKSEKLQGDNVRKAKNPPRKKKLIVRFVLLAIAIFGLGSCIGLGLTKMDQYFNSPITAADVTLEIDAEKYGTGGYCMYVGDRAEYHAVATWSGFAGEQPEFTIDSSRWDCVRIENGELVAVGAGCSYITVRYGSLEAKAYVRVRDY